MDKEQPMKNIKEQQLVIGIKGAGEIATGIAWRLFQSGFKKIFMMETDHPLAVRRQVSFCESIHDDTIEVEGITARKAADTNQIPVIWEKNEIPVIIDPAWSTISALHPHVVIDAIIAKKNLGTNLTEAPLVIGLGPGFEAGKDTTFVIETNRGHNLGRVILQGPAEPNTGVPGNIGGKTAQRVVRAPCDGIFKSDVPIGTIVSQGDIIGQVNGTQIKANIDGIIRGQIRIDTQVTKGLKIGDIDPRGNISYVPTISEKARAIGGSILEAILRKYNQ